MTARRRSLGSLVQPAVDSELPPPVSAAHAEAGAGRYSMVAPRARARRRRMLTVLIVEAEESVGRFMIDIVTLAGHAPLYARTVADARLRLEEARFDVVMLDLHLDGESATQLLGDLVEGAQPPGIVVVSSYRLAEAIAQEHGAAFVRKPFDVADVADAIERAVGRPPSIAP